MSALNVQVGGGHYKKYKIQPIEMLDCLMLPFSLCSAIKYMRHADKNGIEDIRKSYHCIQLYLEHPHGHLRRLIARLIYWRNRKKFEQFYTQFPYFESIIIQKIVENYLDGGRFICPFLDLQALYAAHGGSVIDLMAMHGKEGK